MVYTRWNACRVDNILFLIRFRGARGRKIVTTYTISWDHKFFRISGSYPDRRLHQNALLEPVALMQNSIFEKGVFFSTKIIKINFYKTRRPAGCQKLTLLEEAFVHRIIKQIYFFLVLLPPKCRQYFIQLRRFLTPHLSREGLYGVKT